MGWGHCGINSVTGEEMGYCIQGKCSCLDCDEEIDHGLSYVCGGMHEGGQYGCGRYFCDKHISSSAGYTIHEEEDDHYGIFPDDNDRQLCMKCEKDLKESLEEEYGKENVEYA